MWEISRTKTVRTALCACGASHGPEGGADAARRDDAGSQCLCHVPATSAGLPLPWELRRIERRRQA